MKLNDYSFDFKEKLFPVSITIGNGRFLYRPKSIPIREMTDYERSSIEDILPHTDFYRICQSPYIVQLFTKTKYMDKYKEKGVDVWTIGDTMIMYQKGVGMFINDREVIQLSARNTDDYKVASYRVVPMNVGGNSIDDHYIVIGPTKFRRRTELAYKFCSNILKFNKPNTRGFLLSINEYNDFISRRKNAMDSVYLVTGDLLEEVIREYNDFGGMLKPIRNVDKLLIVKKGRKENEIDKVGSIKLEELY